MKIRTGNEDRQDRARFVFYNRKVLRHQSYDNINKQSGVSLKWVAFLMTSR